MYKAMIVDDENFIVEGLKVIINWNELGFDICGFAYDGVTAFEKIVELKPHLVVTDIKMPFCGGLELMGRVKGVLPQTKFIILSGYREFEYAKAALETDAKGYLLKPVNREELLELLAQTKREIEKEEFQEIEINSLQQRLTESMPVLREKYLGEMVNGYYTKKTDLIGRFDFLGIEHDFPKYLVCLLELGDPLGSLAEKQLMLMAIRKIIGEVINEAQQRKAIVFDSNRDKICIIFPFHNGETNLNGWLPETLNTIIVAVENYLKINIFIGKSSIYTELEKISLAYQECEKALKSRLVLPYHNIIDIEQINLNESPFLYPVDLEKEMLDLIELGDGKAIEKCREILGLMLGSHCPPNYIYYSCISIISDIIKLILPMGIQAEVVLGSREITIEKILEFKSSDELKQFMATIIAKAVHHISEKRKKKISGIISEIIKYIDKNFAANLTLEAVARQFHINACYLSQLFKKETGRTFLDYLTYLRLKEAKKLLLNTDYKIYEIAALVGYTSQRYFSDLFEKNMGCKPTAFKRES